MRINFIYIFLLLGFGALYYMSMRFIIGTNEFYGIAESHVKTINLAYPVEIKSIKVTLGQQLKKGDLIAVVERMDLPLRYNAIEMEMRQLEMTKINEVQRLKIDLDKLEANQKLLLTNFQESVKQLELEKEVQEKLLKSIQSFDIAKVDNKLIRQKLESLQNQFKDQNSVVQTSIEGLQKQIQSVTKPIDAEIQKLVNEKALLKKQEDLLKIYAPQDGIVSDLAYIGGEKVNAYAVLMNINDIRPNMVTTYVGEAKIVDIKLGQEMEIYPIHNKMYRIKGRVIGLGNRITSIPERLIKIQMLKTWGREVIISIPKDNQLLQGEKVRIIAE